VKEVEGIKEVEEFSRGEVPGLKNYLGQAVACECSLHRSA
jgi:hypothetical protein